MGRGKPQRGKVCSWVLWGHKGKIGVLRLKGRSCIFLWPWVGEPGSKARDLGPFIYEP